DDLTALASAFGITGPDPLKDVGVLASIAGALDVIARYRIKAATLVSLGVAAPSASTAAAARSTFQTQYSQAQWFNVIQPVEDAPRLKRRAAPVPYLLSPPAGFTLNGQPFSGFPSTDEMFGYYLIDPEMSCCAITTRLLQASLSIQQFVQRCYLN